MKIITKINVGDTGWYISDGGIHSSRVVEIEIRAKPLDLSSEGRVILKNWAAIDTRYHLADSTCLSEDKIFPTRAKLLAPCRLKNLRKLKSLDNRH